jgi:hypothetical protein
VDVVGREPHRKQVEATPPGRRVEQGDGIERVRIEQVRKVADGVGEIDQPTLVGPLLVLTDVEDAEGEGGRLSGLARRHDRVRKLLLGMEDEVDLLARLLLEGGDDLPDRLVLLRVVAFIPPDDEIGAPSAKRRRCEHRGENNDLLAHDMASLIRWRPDAACL